MPTTFFKSIALAVAAAGIYCLAGPTAATAQETGFAARKPIVAASCRDCPWGLIADVLKPPLAAQGYELLICYTCSRENNPRIVAGTVEPPQTDRRGSPPPPKGKVDFGITSASAALWAYQGRHEYAKDGPRSNFRLIARVEIPQYLLFAVNEASGIDDPTKIAAMRKPLRIVSTPNPAVQAVLAYYGMTKEAVESWGGKFITAEPEDREHFDVIVANSVYLGEAPEVSGYNEMAIRNKLRYFDMPEDLRDRLAKDFEMRKVDMPRFLLRGVDRPYKTVEISGQAIYARDDMPEDFAYLLAKTLDENRAALRWTHMPLSYDNRSVFRNGDMPLHPGAARYYREVAYLRN
jgi:TRAP-type uncharacterized transport system substrate-binding protein